MVVQNTTCNKDLTESNESNDNHENGADHNGVERRVSGDRESSTHSEHSTDEEPEENDLIR